MAEDRNDPSVEVVEADLLERQRPLDPKPLTETELIAAGNLVDGAHGLQQEAPVPDENDYPRDPS